MVTVTFGISACHQHYQTPPTGNHHLPKRLSEVDTLRQACDDAWRSGPVTMDDLSPQGWKEVTKKTKPLERGSRKFTHSTIPDKKDQKGHKLAELPGEPVFGKGVRQQYKGTQPTEQQLPFPGVGVLAAWATLTLKPLLATFFSPTRTGELGGSSQFSKWLL